MEATLVESSQSAIPDDDSQECTVLDQGTGRYFGHFQPLFSGRYELSVRLDGQHVPGSPFSHWVLARHCYPRMSVVQFEGPSSASIGVPLGSQVPMVLYLRDAFGNHIQTAISDRRKSYRAVTVNVRQAGDTAKQAMEVCGEDKGDGCVRFWFGLSPNEQLGSIKYDVEVKYGGREVK